MRAFVRPILALALASALPAYADPLDGSERGGKLCSGAAYEIFMAYYAVVSGGPYAVADVLRNNGGVVVLDDVEGATNITMTCVIESADGGDIMSVTSQPSNTVVVLPPQVVAFSPYSDGPFGICTSLTWTNNRGGTETANAGCQTMPLP